MVPWAQSYSWTRVAFKQQVQQHHLRKVFYTSYAKNCPEVGCVLIFMWRKFTISQSTLSPVTPAAEIETFNYVF